MKPALISSLMELLRALSRRWVRDVPNRRTDAESVVAAVTAERSENLSSGAGTDSVKAIGVEPSRGVVTTNNLPEQANVYLKRRERVIHGVIAAAAFLIGLRLIQLQVVCHDQFAHQAQRQQVSDEPMLARTGDVLDRNGRLLATTISVPSLYVCPAHIDDIPKFSGQLALALNLNPDELRKKIQRNSKKQFLWVKRRLSDEQAAAVQKLNLPRRVAGFRREFQRHYPQGRLAAHLLGTRNIDGKGQGGIEEAFDHLLTGRNGVRRFVRDARGYVLDVLEEVTEPPVDGTSIMLTIDAVLQLHVEHQLDELMEKHRAKGACAIVMNPRSGEVLAMASRPTFDPNHPEKAVPAAWKNMCIASMFEPGSTFKPMVAAWALEHQLIDRDAVFDCEGGAYRMGRRILHDHHPYGQLSLTDVLVKSSNIGMAKIGEQLGNAQLYQLSEAFGFGRRTGIELPGEIPGLLRPLIDWNSYSTGSIPMGQELAATPIQMIAAHAVLANGGQRISPHLLLKTLDHQPRAQQVMVNRVVSEETANWIVREPLVQVVERGTGRQAQISGITVFGKTGTAQKTARDGSGYSSTRHLSSFIGGANAGDPQLLVLISVDEPQGNQQYGGSVAAPFVAEILKAGMELHREQDQPSPVRLASEPEAVEE